MEHWGLITIIAAIAIGILVIAMSLTLIFKGRHPHSEIGKNPNMKKLGIRCTADQMRESEGYPTPEGCHGCSHEDCAVHQTEKECNPD